MSDTKVVIPDELREEGDDVYVSNKLIPTVHRLNKVVNEFMGTSEREEYTTFKTLRGIYLPIDYVLKPRKRMSIVFNPNDYPLSKGNKRRKILFTCDVRSKRGNTCEFKLCNTETRAQIKNSYCATNLQTYTTFTRYLQVSTAESHIQPNETEYHIVGCYKNKEDYAICREINLVAVYVD